MGSSTAQSQKGEEKKSKQPISMYLYRPVWKIQRLVTMLLYSRCLWDLPAYAWSLLLSSSFLSLSPVPSHCLSCSPIVGYFLFGAVVMYRKVSSSQFQVHPNHLHIVLSTSPSPIKQASQAWLRKKSGGREDKWKANRLKPNINSYIKYKGTHIQIKRHRLLDKIFLKKDPSMHCLLNMTHTG